MAANGKLNPDVPDPIEIFGFGRRICPGRYFALDTIWLAIANVLAAFSLEKPLDEDGNIIEPSGEFVSGLFRRVPLELSTSSGSLMFENYVTSPPKPFKASIKPRFSGAVELIRSPILEFEDE